MSGEGQEEDGLCAQSETAADDNSAMMACDKRLHECQSDAGPYVLLAVALHLVQPVEYLGQFLSGDSSPRIGYADNDLFPLLHGSSIFIEVLVQRQYAVVFAFFDAYIDAAFFWRVPQTV